MPYLYDVTLPSQQHDETGAISGLRLTGVAAEYWFG